MVYSITFGVRWIRAVWSSIFWCNPESARKSGVKQAELCACGFLKSENPVHSGLADTEFRGDTNPGSAFGS